MIKKRQNKKKGIQKYTIMLVVIFMILWQIPKFFLELGAIGSGLLPVAAFFISLLIVKNIQKMKLNRSKTKN